MTKRQALFLGIALVTIPLGVGAGVVLGVVIYFGTKIDRETPQPRTHEGLKDGKFKGRIHPARPTAGPLPLRRGEWGSGRVALSGARGMAG
jgi:hypothetical protein